MNEINESHYKYLHLKKTKTAVTVGLVPNNKQNTCHTFTYCLYGKKTEHNECSNQNNSAKRTFIVLVCTYQTVLNIFIFMKHL